MSGNWDYEEELTKELKEKEEKIKQLTHNQQDQFRQINLLFDEKAKDYAEIDFNGLHSLLKGVAERAKSPLSFDKDGERERERERESKEIGPIFSRKRKEKK
jgi:hypothetical protein